METKALFWTINLVVYLIGFKIHVTITYDALQLLLTRARVHTCPACPRVLQVNGINQYRNTI